MQSVNLETDLPARIADERTQLLMPNSAGKVRGLILAAITAVFGALRPPFVAAATGFARPADTTAYTSGDLVANNVTAGSVTPIQLTVARTNNGLASIRRVRLVKSAASVTNAAFRVHLFATAPTVANGDNAAFSGIRASYIGAFDVASMQTFTDGAQGAGLPLVGTEVMFHTAGGGKIIYALLEARGAYTPASGETFTLTVEGLQA